MEETPSTRSNNGAIVSSASVFSSLSGKSPSTARRMIGIEDELNLNIEGVLQLSGKRPWILDSTD